MTDQKQQLRQLTTKRLNTPRARRVCELAVVLQRLEHANERIALAVKVARATKGDEAAAISDSLTRDAIVTFLACFDKNKDVNLDRSIFTSKTDRETFDQLKDLRDSTLAHMFGAMHLADYLLLLDPDSGELLNAFCGQASICNLVGASQLLSPLLKRALEFSREQMKLELDSLTNELSGMSNEELLALEAHNRIDLPGAVDWMQSRNSFRKNGRTV